MAPTSDDIREPVAGIRIPRFPTPRPSAGYLFVFVGLGLVVALLFGLLYEARRDDSSPPQIARPIRLALDRARPATPPFEGYTEVQLALGDDCVRLVVADADTERSNGLRGREAPAPYEGMVFLFDDTHRASFTMQGVGAPLSIGWYDAAGRAVDRAEMVPCPAKRTDCPPYSSRGPYRFAVETPGGALPGGALGACPS